MVAMFEESWTLNAPHRQVADCAPDSELAERAAISPSLDSIVGLAAAVSSWGLNSDIQTT